MRGHILSSLLISGSVLFGGNLQAQQPAPPNLDAIPEKMPLASR